MNPPIEARNSGLVAHCRKRGRSAGEEIGQHCDSGRGKRRMSRAVRREVRQTNRSLDARVELARPWVEVEELRFPASNGGVVHCHVEKGEGARSANLAHSRIAHVLCGDVTPMPARRLSCRSG